MTLYEKALETSANQSESNATTEEITLRESTVTKFSAFLDPASNGEVRTEVKIGRSGTIPDRKGDPLRTPGRTGPVDIDIDVGDEPTDIVFKAWAPNASFAHEVIIQLETETEDGGWFTL